MGGCSCYRGGGMRDRGRRSERPWGEGGESVEEG